MECDTVKVWGVLTASCLGGTSGTVGAALRAKLSAIRDPHSWWGVWARLVEGDGHTGCGTRGKSGVGGWARMWTKWPVGEGTCGAW